MGLVGPTENPMSRYKSCLVQISIETETPHMIDIRPYHESDQAPVRDLFIKVNRLIAPRGMESAFEQYIERSLDEEIMQIPDYYAQRNGGFWVATSQNLISGMFGLEETEAGVFELRRMYVDPDFRRMGIARQLLEYGETCARDMGARQIILSTSELQQAALALYRNAGYHASKEEVAKDASNKTIGGGIRRYHFVKDILAGKAPD